MKILNEDYSTKEKLAIIDDFEKKFRETTTSLGGDFDDYRAQVTPQTAVFLFVTYTKQRSSAKYKINLSGKLTEVMKNSEYSDISRIDINEIDYAPEGFKGYEVYIRSYIETEGF